MTFVRASWIDRVKIICSVDSRPVVLVSVNSIDQNCISLVGIYANERVRSARLPCLAGERGERRTNYIYRFEFIIYRPKDTLSFYVTIRDLCDRCCVRYSCVYKKRRRIRNTFVNNLNQWSARNFYWSPVN